MFARLEVLTIMAHLVVTLGLLALYGVTTLSGHPDPTLQNGLLLAIGFWFGAAGGVKAAVKRRKPDGGDTTNE